VTLNLQRSYDKGYYITHEQDKALYNYMYSDNKSFLGTYRDSSEYPIMDQLNLKTTELLKLINAVEYKMIAESEGKPGRPAEYPRPIVQAENGQEIKFELLSRPFHTSPANDFLLPGTSSRTELETALAGYKTYLSGIIPVSALQNLDQMLDPSTCLPPKIPEVRHISLLSGLHSLALLKNSLLAIESYSMASITENK